MALMLLADRKSNIPLFYYVLAGIALTVIILAIYHLIVAVCYRRRRLPRRRIDGEAPTEARCGCQETPNIRLIPAYKYSKEVGLARGSGNECAVCLSAFVDGEEIRQLPECGHAFHMPCVDMWLDSHSNCPLCRARVVAPHRLHQIPVAEAGVEGGGPPNSGDLA